MEVIPVLKTISKTVKAETRELTNKERSEIKEMFKNFENCLNMFNSQYSGIRSLEKIQNAKNLRNDIRKHMFEHNYDLAEWFHFQGRHWVMALFQCCGNLKSNWTNLGNRIKKDISENPNLSEDEKSYIRYIVSAPRYWSCVLNYKPFTPNKTLSKFVVTEDRLHYIHNLIRRQTRKRKFKTPHSDNLTCMMLDQEMYTIFEKDGKTYISIVGLIKGKRMVFELKSPYHYDRKGDIQLIYNQEKNVLEIHKCIQVNVKEIKAFKNKELGADKGCATLLSCSNDKEYGENFNKLIYEHADYVNANTKAHNQIRDQLKKLYEDFANSKDKDARLVIIHKIRNIEECNSGKRTFNKKQEKFQAHVEQAVNKSIKEMLDENSPKVLGLEDLSFSKSSKTKDKKNDYKTKEEREYNRKMSMWTKGILDERLEYISESRGTSVKKVNAAYTSQFCAECGAPLLERKGPHKGISVCPNCGEINANTNAGKNILARLNDPEITIYTPHKKILEILLDRYNKKNQPQTKNEEKVKTKRSRKTSNKTSLKSK